MMAISILSTQTRLHIFGLSDGAMSTIAVMVFGIVLVCGRIVKTDGQDENPRAKNSTYVWSDDPSDPPIIPIERSEEIDRKR